MTNSFPNMPFIGDIGIILTTVLAIVLLALLPVSQACMQTRVVPSHRSSSFESSGKEGAHTTSQSMSEGRTKEEERDACVSAS
ncbi:hypothetical protein DdX_17747 [Ditylenchus destructor]|uniref:Uncharacterized protein n=1 Tax=Ditylenchus destructor TaxID=166010 RepID=A0AAD4MKU7_9BILA|nr:hypothetical protein DdX_17747 [Ditylenchus destructor]